MDWRGDEGPYSTCRQAREILGQDWKGHGECHGEGAEELHVEIQRNCRFFKK
jgi:hypothetical protein